MTAPITSTLWAMMRRGGRSSTIPTTFHYDPGDPYAVNLTVIHDVEGPEGGLDIHSWLFARDLLVQGLNKAPDEPAVRANGCVTVRPHAGAIALDLEGPWPARLECHPDALRTFIDETQQLVPSGRESDLIEWEPWLSGITVPRRPKS